MPLARTARRSTAERVGRSQARLGREPSQAARILALQRQAGNRAVAGAIARQRVLQRHAEKAEESQPTESGAEEFGLGQSLVAHELTHVAQQAHPGATWLQRAEKLGTPVTEPKGAKPPFKTVSATFDGDRFVLVADGKSIVDVPAQSGHPNTVEKADAKACAGSESDSYLNNVRYVGIKDRGAIPEGEYTFRHSSMVRFSAPEQARMALAPPGQFVDPSGLDLHGDWGAGRAALTPVRVLPSRFCGSTGARSGFYLHGGVMTGSSGCIDIGNDGITTVIDRLMGYAAPVPVKVRYTKPPPSVSALQRKAGEFMYPGKKDPSMMDRLKSVLGLGD